MKIRQDWSEHQHKHKEKEAGLIFSKCPECLFSTALELGAGNGFQATLLSKYVSRLISTEFNPDILKNKNTESIEYRICNAEEAVNAFDRKGFDLIFSSNLLEHLANPRKALSGIRELLKDDGITIHIMPNPFWKLCHMLFYIPNRCLIVLERILNNKPIRTNSMPKTRTVKKSLMHSLLTIKPHGVSDGNIKEFFAFTKSRWIREFEKANLELVSIIKGPVHSGYGFGLDFLRSIMENIGFSSEYIYIAVKKGQNSFYRRYFEHKTEQEKINVY